MLKETPITAILNAAFVMVVVGTPVALVTAGSIWGFNALTMVATSVLALVAFSIVAGLWLRKRLVAPINQLSELADMATAYRHHRRISFMSPLPEIRAMADALEASRTVFSAETALLKRERDAFEAVLTALEEGVVALSEEGKVIRCNPSAKSLLGINGPIAGKNINELARLPEMLRLHSEAISSKEIVRGDSIDFQGKTLSLVAIPMSLSNDGEGVVVVLHDLTELRRLEQVRSDFVANVSHELKTPLTSISGYVETLLDGAADDVSVRDGFLRKISANSQRLKNLSNDLLTLARLENSDDEGKSDERFNIDRALSTTAEALEDKALKKSLELDLDLRAEQGDAIGDKRAFEQAIYNLVDNAINYTPEGGKIVLSSEVKDKRLVVRIADNGIGIAEIEQPRVFERFYRVDKVRSREASGTGLGLAIVRHVISSLGGEIALTSRVGEGTTFTIKLPLAES